MAPCSTNYSSIHHIRISDKDIKVSSGLFCGVHLGFALYLTLTSVLVHSWESLLWRKCAEIASTAALSSWRWSWRRSSTSRSPTPSWRKPTSWRWPWASWGSSCSRGCATATTSRDSPTAGGTLCISFPPAPKQRSLRLHCRAPSSTRIREPAAASHWGKTCCKAAAAAGAQCGGLGRECATQTLWDLRGAVLPHYVGIYFQPAHSWWVYLLSHHIDGQVVKSLTHLNIVLVWVWLTSVMCFPLCFKLEVDVVGFFWWNDCLLQWSLTVVCLM